jgi:hypothetical protein
MPLTLKEEEDRLNERERLLNETQVFWSNLIQLKMSEFNFVAEKLKENYSGENYQRLEILTKQLRHLDQKRDFELKEYNKLQAEQETFVEKQTKDLMQTLSGKLSQKFNNSRKKVKSS